jgi:hypothetical protein
LVLRIQALAHGQEERQLTTRSQFLCQTFLLFLILPVSHSLNRKTETKPNFYWLHSWWWFRAQMSALQQATAFLGATNRDATTIPPVLIRRNTSTLNDTFTGDRRFTSSFVSADARRRRILREPATANGPTVLPCQYFRHCS